MQPYFGVINDAVPKEREKHECGSLVFLAYAILVILTAKGRAGSIVPYSKSRAEVESVSEILCMITQHYMCLGLQAVAVPSQLLVLLQDNTFPFQAVPSDLEGGGGAHLFLVPFA